MTQFYFQVPIYFTVEAPDADTALRYSNDICAAALLAERGLSMVNIAAQAEFARQHHGALMINMEMAGPALITEDD